MICFYVVVTLGILIILFILFDGIRIYVRSMKSLSWPATEGELKVAKPEVTRGISDGKPFHIFSAEVKYSYSVQEVTYESNDITVRDHPLSTKNKARKLIKSIITDNDKKVTVYYNPKKPKMAVLIPGFHNQCKRAVCGNLSAIPLIAMLFGLIASEFLD